MLAPSAPELARLEDEFRQTWLIKVSKRLPAPTLVLGGWAAWNAPDWKLFSVCLALFIAINLSLTFVQSRWMNPTHGDLLRAVVNSPMVFLISLTSGPGGYGWMLVLTVILGSMFSVSRAVAYFILLTAVFGAVAGSFVAGSTVEEVVTALMVLMVVSAFTESIYVPLKKAHVAEKLRSAQVQQALSFRKSFLASMSHEIRTPLNGFLGMAEVLRDTPLSAEQHEMVDVMLSSGQGLKHILNDILDLSKLEAGQMELEHIPYSPSELLSDVVSLMSLAAREKGLRLSSSADGLPPMLVGDPSRLRQVVLNLLGNAVKFTEEGGVRIAMRWDGSELSVAVSDTGIGIDAETQAKLFVPFQQADVSISRRYGGTGLGLSISRRLTEMMGGTLSLTSAPGEGATFCLTIPAPRSHVPPPAPEDLPELSPLRVLVVDDHPVNLRVTEAMLRRMGCDVTTACSGREALVFAPDAFDVVLMDYQMPEMDGAQATSRMREVGFSVPILALTAGVTRAEVARCRAAGMEAVLAKPIDARTLSEALERWCSRAPLSSAHCA